MAILFFDFALKKMILGLMYISFNKTPNILKLFWLDLSIFFLASYIYKKRASNCFEALLAYGKYMVILLVCQPQFFPIC